MGKRKDPHGKKPGWHPVQSAPPGISGEPKLPAGAARIRAEPSAGGWGSSSLDLLGGTEIDEAAGADDDLFNRWFSRSAGPSDAGGKR